MARRGRRTPTRATTRYLVDRVRVAKGERAGLRHPVGLGRRQGNPEPRTPIEDAAMVDVRRASVGLGTIDDYLEELARAP